jgi:hypothetical protein
MSSTAVDSDGPPVGWRRATRSGTTATVDEATAADDAESTGLPRRIGVPELATAAVAVAVAAVAVYQVHAGNSWHPPFFFDEEWKVDFIRSSHPIDRMLTNDAPIPLGWVGLMHFITAPIPYHPIVFRVIASAWFLAGVGVLALFFVRLLQRPASHPERFQLRDHVPPAPLLAAPIGVALAIFSPLVINYVQTFNNYTFEIFWIAVLVLATEELDRSRWALRVWCVVLALSPLMVLGGLFVVPAVVVYAGWWAWRDDMVRRRSRLLAVGAACLVGAVIAAAEWIKIYKPVGSKPSIQSFWIDWGSSLGGSKSLFDLLGYSWSQLTSQLIGDRLWFADGWVRWTAYAVLAVGIVVGLVVVGRRWPWLLATIGSAWMLSILASAATHWPMTLERVNLCWQILLYALIGVGLARAVLWVTGRFWYVGLGLLALCFAALWFPPVDVGIDLFGRNLTYDLQQVADSPAQHNLVLQYHKLAQFYADNELVNTSHGDRTFDIRWEGQHDPDPLIVPVDPVIRGAGLQPGDMVWCVTPAESGNDSLRDCQINDPSNLELVTDTKGIDAHVVGYRVK